MRSQAALALLPLLAAGCTERARVPVIAVAAPPPTIVAPPPPTNQRYAPETPGGWSYAADAGRTVARYGRGATAEFELQCDRATRSVRLSRLGSAAGTMTIRTSYGERAWPTQLAEGRTMISLTAADPFLDQIAFSRGRFSVALEGLPPLIMPAWAEPSRVIEDCRAA